VSKFEVYKDKKGETRFRFRAANGEIVFTSESYKARASAMKTIESIRKSIVDAPVETVDDAAKKSGMKKVAGKAVKAVAGAAAAVAAPVVKAVSRAGSSKPKAASNGKAAAKPAKSATPKAAAAGSKASAKNAAPKAKAPAKA